jgi:hypothetical protein
MVEAGDSLRKLNEDWRALERRTEVWKFHAGRLRVEGHFPSQRLAWWFAGFHVIVGAAGVVLSIFARGAAQSLGLALVVGSLFGLGAFMAQAWSLQVERERWLGEEDIRAEAARLNARLDQLLAEMKNTPSSGPRKARNRSQGPL